MKKMYWVLLCSAVLLFLFVVTMHGGSPPYDPPPNIFDIPEPDFPPPPDIWDIPFPDPEDLPDPIEIDFPEPDFPDPPIDFPIDFPDPPPFPDIDDPFPDLPSLFPGDEIGYSIGVGPDSTATAAGIRPNLTAAVANKLTKLMPFPMRLPFPPAPTAARTGTPKRRVCDPAMATKLLIPETHGSTVVFIDTCPYSMTARVSVGTTPSGIAATPDGQSALVTTLSPAAVSIINLATKKVTATIQLAGDSQPNNIAVLPDGSRAYVTSHEYMPSARLFVVDLVSRRVLTTMFVDGYPAAMAVTPDGSQVWVTSRGEGTVTVIDTMTNSVVTKIENVTLATGIAFNPTGSIAYAAAGIDNGNGTIQVIDTGKYQIVNSITVGVLPHVVAVTPSGQHVFVTNALSGTISQISTATNKVVRTINVGRHPLGITFLQ